MTEQEYRAAYMREYRKNNKEKVADIQHRSYMKHREERLAAKKRKKEEIKNGR